MLQYMIDKITTIRSDINKENLIDVLNKINNEFETKFVFKGDCDNPFFYWFIERNGNYIFTELIFNKELIEFKIHYKKSTEKNYNAYSLTASTNNPDDVVKPILKNYNNIIGDNIITTRSLRDFPFMNKRDFERYDKISLKFEICNGVLQFCPTNYYLRYNGRYLCPVYNDFSTGDLNFGAIDNIVKFLDDLNEISYIMDISDIKKQAIMYSKEK